MPETKLLIRLHIGKLEDPKSVSHEIKCKEGSRPANTEAEHLSVLNTTKRAVAFWVSQNSEVLLRFRYRGDSFIKWDIVLFFDTEDPYLIPAFFEIPSGVPDNVWFDRLRRAISTLIVEIHKLRAAHSGHAESQFSITNTLKTENNMSQIGSEARRTIDRLHLIDTLLYEFLVKEDDAGNELPDEVSWPVVADIAAALKEAQLIPYWTEDDKEKALKSGLRDLLDEQIQDRYEQVRDDLKRNFNQGAQS